jgi:hypothetical protein
MVFALLCFTGIFVMFFYIMRSLEKFQEHMRKEHAQLRVQIRALEARLDGTASSVPASPSGESQAPLVLTPQDPLNAVPDDPLARFEPGR